MSVDITTLKTGDRVMVGPRAPFEAEVLAVGDEAVFYRQMSTGDEDCVLFQYIVRKIHPKVKADELVPVERWAALVSPPPDSTNGANQIVVAAGSLADAFSRRRDVVGAVRLVPETDADGYLVIHWRDEAEQ